MRFVVANWKMNGSRNYAKEFALGLRRIDNEIGGQIECIACPPFVLIDVFADMTSGVGGCKRIKVGAQDCHHELSGAYTGSISAEMLKDAGCGYVIVGHSERRSACKESDELIKNKALAASRAGLRPVICIGESEYLADPWDFLEKQCIGSIPECDAIIAYEPVWAIGSGRVPSLADIERVVSKIKAYTALPVLYGGSVNPENATDIMKLTDGLLVGSASLDIGKFAGIILALSSLHG
ncbi:triosephosphate isomerase [Rickettsiales bacterium]|nr:triosephosphate isomerase [Rickettsiales bacterium]